MSKRYDLVGLRFGRLTVESSAGAREKRREWFCRCDCGEGKVVTTGGLRGHGVRSCGCWGKENLAKIASYNRGKHETHPAWRGGITFLNATIRSMRRAAESRGYAWELTGDQCRTLFMSPCFYCGSAPNNVRRDPSYRGPARQFTYSGLDRVDNSRGYTSDNVAPCCRRCNYSKGRMPLPEWKDHMLVVLGRWPEIERRLKEDR